MWTNANNLRKTESYNNGDKSNPIVVVSDDGGQLSYYKMGNYIVCSCVFIGMEMGVINQYKMEEYIKQAMYGIPHEEAQA